MREQPTQCLCLYYTTTIRKCFIDVHCTCCTPYAQLDTVNHTHLLVQLLHADQIKRLNAGEKEGRGGKRERGKRRERWGERKRRERWERGREERGGKRKGERTLNEPPDTSSPGHHYLPLGSVEEHHSKTVVKHNGKQ